MKLGKNFPYLLIAMLVAIPSLINASYETYPSSSDVQPKKIVKVQQVKQKKKTTLDAEDIEKILEVKYKEKSGFDVPESERKVVTEAGGSPVYGELLPKSWETVLKDLDAMGKLKGNFYDLGSGNGKLVVQAILQYPKKLNKATGVELLKTRYQQAQDVKEALVKEGLISERKLQFKNEDIAKTDIHDATVVFMCSTCYPQPLMQTMVERFGALKKGLVVLTLEKLPDTYKDFGLKYIKQYTLPTSWNRFPGSDIHMYELQKTVKKPAVKKVTTTKKETVKGTKEENLKELIDIVINKKQLLSTMKFMTDMISKQYNIQTPVTEIMENLSDELSSDKTKEAFMNIYSKFFDEEDIQNLLEFYKSNSGKKLLEKTPEIASEITEVSLNVLQPLLDKYVKEAKEKKEPTKEEAAKIPAPKTEKAESSK